MTVRVTPMTVEHAPAVLAIYQDGVDTGDATFDTQAPDWVTFDAKHLSEHRFVAGPAGRVLGWVAGASVSSRSVYEGVIEDSVYVAATARGAGIGKLLLQALIRVQRESRNLDDPMWGVPGEHRQLWPYMKARVSALSGRGNGAPAADPGRSGRRGGLQGVQCRLRTDGAASLPERGVPA
jgi:phosphinothricin acetyltransferase